MDQLKGAINKFTSGGGNSGQQQQQQGGDNNNNNNNNQQEDYVDKGLDAVEKKFGVQESRETNEKITDAGRNFFEKETGKNVPDKFSN